MRRLAAIPGALAAVLCVAAAVPAVAAAQGINQTPNQDYVAMGDSYSSGNGTGNYYESTCYRSYQAYGPLIDPQIPGSFSHPACSGARTPHIDQSSQNGYPKQIDLLGPDTKYVSLTIGGNDAGFTDALTNCAVPFGGCTDPGGTLDQAEAFINNQLPALLDRNYAAIRQKAPNATVAVLGYPRIFRPDQTCILVFSTAEVNRANQLADRLAEVTRERALAAGFSFVDSRQPFIGHGSCDSANWINEFSVSDTVGSFHPTANGYQSFAGTVRSTLLASPRPGQSRGPNGRIALSSSRTGNPEIFAINGNGDFPVNLTNDPAADIDPAFSPDGTKLAFASDRDGDNEIYVLDIETGALTKLTGNVVDDREPSWSPNGDLIVFRTSRDGNDEIYSMTAGGGSVTRLTSNGVADGAPSWSPDGSEIVFQRTVSGSNNDVFRMNSDGQGQVNLTASSSSNDAAPEWSPNGNSIAFQSNRDGNAEIYTMTRAGSTVTRRTSVAGDDTQPTYSPNGASIAFTSTRDGDPETYTMTATGGSQTRRTTSPGADLSPSWQGDGTPPRTTIDSGPSGTIATRQASFEFHANEPGSTLACRVDGGAFAPCTSPFTTGTLGNGEHTFEVRATDPSGNVEPSPASRSFTVAVPEDATTIDSAPSGTTRDRSPQFAFSSGIAGTTFECRIDGGAFASCVSPFTAPSLADGEHTFEVRGTPPGGEAGAPVSSTFVVDGTAPETTIDVAPPARGNLPRPIVEFSASEAGSSFECRLDSDAEGDWTPCASPFQPAERLADGQHRFEVRATDLAGNAEATPAVAEFEIDTEAPVTAVDSAPPPRTTSSTATFAFSSEPDARFECRFDSGDEAAWQACTSPATRSSLADGQHTFEVRAIDEVGNVEDPPRAVTFTVDATPPDTSIDDGPVAGSFINDREPVFAFSSPDELEPTFECRLFATPSPIEAPWVPCDQSFQPSALGDGGYRFEVRAKDGFDNVDPSPASLDFTVDTTRPETTITGGPQGKVNALTGFQFAAGEPATYECRVDEDAWQPCSSGWLPTVADGQHTFRVRATDRAGNVEAEPASRDFDLRRTAPETTVTGGPAGPTNAATPAFTFASDYPEASFECRLDTPAGEGTWESCESGRSYPGLGQGNHTFRVRAKDGYGNTDQTPAFRSFTRDTDAPAVSIGAVPARIGTRELSISFAKGDATTVVCRLDGVVLPACSSPQQLSGLGDGSHTFAVTGTDAAGNSATDSKSFVVDTVAPATTITSGPQGATATASPQFSFTGSEADVRFDCRVDSGTWDECDSPHSTGPLPDGEHTFEVRATDRAGNAEANPPLRRFTVDTKAPDTAITAGPSGPTRDAAPRFEFSSSERVAGFACRIDGRAFTPCRSGARLSPLGDGPHVLEVRASDEAGNADPTPATRSFTVDTRVAEPSVSVPAKVKVKRGKVKLPVTVSAGEPARTEATATVIAGRKKLRLPSASRALQSRARSTIVVALRSRRQAKLLSRQLATRGRAKAQVTVTIADSLGNQVTESRWVKLAGKRKP